jgi:hypothetical protein
MGRKEKDADAELEIVIFGTLRRGGFQVYPAHRGAVDSEPWRSQRSLERFYSTSVDADSRKKETGGILQALKGRDRFEVYFVRYGVLTELDGRAGGCLGFAFFSRRGFPRNLPKLRTDIFESAMAQFTKEAQLLVKDKQGRLCFKVDAFDSITPYLDNVLKGLTQYIAPEIEESGWQGVPEGVLGEFPVVGSGTSASIAKDILLRHGGIEISARANDVLELKETSLAQAQEARGVGDRNLMVDEPTARVVMSSKEASILEELSWLDETRRLFDKRQTSLMKNLERIRAPEAQPRVPPTPISTNAPQTIDGIGLSSHGSRRKKLPASFPIVIALILSIISAIGLVIYIYHQISREESNTPAHENTTAAGLDTSSSTAEFSVSNKFMEQQQRRVASLDDFLDDVVEFLWKDETIHAEFETPDALASFLKNTNNQQLALVDNHIRTNIKKFNQTAGTVPYNSGDFWTNAIGGNGEGFRIRN